MTKFKVGDVIYSNGISIRGHELTPGVRYVVMGTKFEEDYGECVQLERAPDGYVGNCKVWASDRFDKYSLEELKKDCLK